MRFFMATTVLIAITASSGWIHGRLAGRWQQDRLLVEAGERLGELPDEDLGPWQLDREDSLSDKIVQMLECTGYVTRSYVNLETGDRVTMFVIVGPHGPTVVHTPEICYSSRDYDVAVDKKRKSLVLGDGSRHEFWTLTMESRDELDPHELRVWYGWSDGTRWSAKDYPRWGYLGTPRLYKIQVAGRLRKGSGHASDPVEDFLKHFLPTLRTYMK